MAEIRSGTSPDPNAYAGDPKYTEERIERMKTEPYAMYVDLRIYQDRFVSSVDSQDPVSWLNILSDIGECSRQLLPLDPWV